MTEFTFTSKDPKGLLCVLGEASIEFANENAPQSMALIDELRDQLRAQVKPAFEEPAGDCVVFVFGLAYKRQDNGEWWPLGAISDGWEWPNLIQERPERAGAPQDPEVAAVGGRGMSASYERFDARMDEALEKDPPLITWVPNGKGVMVAAEVHDRHTESRTWDMGRHTRREVA